MSIFEDVTDQMKIAMKARDTDRLRALRSARAAFIEATKKDGSAGIDDTTALTILKRLVKQRRESIAGFEQGGRADLVDLETREMKILASFLPTVADEPTTRRWVEQAIEASGATAAADMGRAMGALMGAHKDEIDGKLANAIVRELLA